jgi:hypothetical protein
MESLSPPRYSTESVSPPRSSTESPGTSKSVSPEVAARKKYFAGNRVQNGGYCQYSFDC